MGMTSNNRGTPKTKNASSKRSSSEETKKDSKKFKEKKKIWSSDTMLEAMKLTCEEVDYRNEKSLELNPVEKYSKLFKCTKCQRNLSNSIMQNKEAPTHPFLGVLMCEKCNAYYEDGEFSLDSDGEDKYCRWCGEGGTLFSCSKCICGFCANCIKQHFSLKFFKTIQKDENWLCFICDPKPLWYQRYICSLAIKMAEESGMPVSSTPSKANHTRSSENNASKVKTLKKRETSPSLIPSSQKVEEEEEEGPSRTKKKRFLIYSSDETDSDATRSPPKEFTFTNTQSVTLANELENENPRNVETVTLTELEKLLKLSQSHMNFGATWCSNTLMKLSKSDYKVTQEGLVNECQKIKWVFSALSTYLVQFSNSVDSLEKSLCQDDGVKVSSGITEKHQPPYTVILQFLGFLNNQIKTFMQKGVAFSDILDAAVYEDENVIGLKKKSSSTDSVTQEMSLNNDSEVTDIKESIDVCNISREKEGLEIETDENNEINLNESESSSLSFSFGEMNNSRTLESTQEIQKLIAILENA